MTQKLKDALKRIITSEKAKALYREADIQSAALTKHGEPHAVGVMEFASRLANNIEQDFPGTFTPIELDFTIPAAGWGHDVGRSKPADIINGKPKDRHEIWGSRIMNDLMVEQDVPAEARKPVCYSIVNHRANGVLGRNALDPLPEGEDEQKRVEHDIKRRTLAVTVLADKCVGDAERVRRREALKLEALRLLGISRWLFDNRADEDARNDFANYAIKSAELVVDSDDDTHDSRYRGAIVLRLKLDERVCTMDQIFKVEWFAEAYHCCGKSAQVLGFFFRIEANGHVWYWSKSKNAWTKRTGLAVPQNP